jgi:hypothetical protein
MMTMRAGKTMLKVSTVPREDLTFSYRSPTSSEHQPRGADTP